MEIFRKCLVIMGVVGVVMGLNLPDIILIDKQNPQICIAGSKTNGYGLAFMSETLEDNVYLDKFEYRDGSGAEIDSSSDCTFENESECLQNWRSNYLSLQTSGAYPIYPVTDERWNNFEVYRTDGRYKALPKYDKYYRIAQQNFFTSFSVRSPRDAQIALCSAMHPRHTLCYWIIIDGITNNFDFTIIRKCVKGVPGRWAEKPDCKLFRAKISTPEKLLNESKWTHFMLSREGGNRIRLWLWDLDTGARPLLDYTDDDPLSLSYMYVRAYNAIADWKVHQYQYFNIHYNENLFRLGPSIYFTNQSVICVSFYVIMCPKCKIDITLEREGGIIETQTSIEGDCEGPFMTWRNIRLQGGISTSSIEYYQLYIKLSTADGNNSNTFWAIDDFRKCSNNESRVGVINSQKKLLCQPLKYYTDKSYNSNNHVEKNAYPRFVSPLLIDKVFFSNVTVKFNNLKVNGEKDIIDTIQLECKKANSSKTWINCGGRINFSLEKKITITNLEKETTYLIRAIIYTKTGDAYRDEDVPIVEVTTCIVDRKIHITETSRNATISFETENDYCSFKSYRIELQHTRNQIISPQTGKQNMILPDLTPYTKYNVRFTNILFPSYLENKKFQTKEEAPSKIKELNILEITDTTVVFSWKEPEEKNGVIQKYIVKYELMKRIECNKSISKSDIILPIKSRVTLSGLQPYSTYNISVAAKTILPGKRIEFLTNTLMISNISEEEIPEYISTTDLTAQSVKITWPVNCLKHRGPLYFQIVLKCMKDEWCNQIPDIVLDNINSMNGGVTTYDLTPFTHYSVVLRAKRSQSGDLTAFNRTTKFNSSEGNPPVVRNSTNYSKDNHSISLRWLDPYLPHGHLEKYVVKYCYSTNTNCEQLEITTNQLASCDLWNECFNCYKLINLSSNTWYTITIMAKNRDVKLFSPDTILKVYTAEDKSSVPLNLTREWINNELKLSWNHPDITNGELKKFIITLNQTGTELENQDDKPFYSYEIKVLKEMKTYSYKIDKTYRYSSSYIVTVCGVNTLYGENATLHIDTPPETPKLSGDVTVDEGTTTASTITVVIPGVKNKTKSVVSFLYVVVSKIYSIPETNSKMMMERKKEGNKLKEEILKYSSYKHAWIAKEIIELNENKFKAFLGSDESTKSQELECTIINYKLEPATEYEITLVLINRYKNESSTNVYRLNVQTASKFRAEFFALFSLVLLPIAVAVFFCFRKFRSRPKSREVINNPTEPGYGYLEPNTLVRNMYLEIVNEPLCTTSDTQNTTLVEGHIYETIIYSTKNPPSYMNLLSEDVPIDEE